MDEDMVVVDGLKRYMICRQGMETEKKEENRRRYIKLFVIGERGGGPRKRGGRRKERRELEYVGAGGEEPSRSSR